MSDEIRINKIEKEIEDLYNSIKKLEDTIASLNITIALLDQLMRGMKEDKERKDSFSSKIQFFIVGSVISAIMAFIISGGLVP